MLAPVTLFRQSHRAVCERGAGWHDICHLPMGDPRAHCHMEWLCGNGHVRYGWMEWNGDEVFSSKVVGQGGCNGCYSWSQKV